MKAEPACCSMALIISSGSHPETRILLACGHSADTADLAQLAQDIRCWLWMARQVLARHGGDQRLAPLIRVRCPDSPLALVIGAQLVALEGLDPATSPPKAFKPPSGLATFGSSIQPLVMALVASPIPLACWSSCRAFASGSTGATMPS